MSSETEEIVNGESLAGPRDARGMLIIVSSPSGGGKGTLIRRVLKTVPNVGYSVSFTTRHAREGETNGRDYFFISEERFREMIVAGEFLEWAHVHANLYGTGRAQVEKELKERRDIILEIDVQGAESVRRDVPGAVGVFILPPSFEVLRDRLTARGSEEAVELSLRLRNARGEVARYREFDYVIINDDAESAAAQLAAVVYAERARRERQEQVAEEVLNSFPL
ncbi:MAG TPA: guanylate kinase [Pyrinomonadaceae bacterium]|nr:guanylate kinase [Pyrinomonadaceae bacterium]